MRNTSFRLLAALIAFNLMSLMQAAEAATVTLATSPLANATASVVRPNIMYVLDNSGSMDWDYLPDYVARGSSGTGSSICWDGVNDSNSRTTCKSAADNSANTVFSSTQMTTTAVQVPLLTSAINFLYYNPATSYQPPYKADGSRYPDSLPTGAYLDGIKGSGATRNFQTATTVATINGTRVNNSDTITVSRSEGLLGTFASGTGIPANTYVTEILSATKLRLSATATSSGTSSVTFKTGAYPHQVYCNTSSGLDEQNLRGNATCKETTNTTNSAELYPEPGSGTRFNIVKSYDGAPYYYVMNPMQYCTDSTYVNCQANLGGAYTVPALYRWCKAYSTSSKTYTDCQDLRNATHTIPDYLGGIYASAVPAVQASASLTISSYIAGKSITGLTVNGTNVIGSTTFTAGSGGLTSTSNIASAICSAIQANSGTSGYSCSSPSGSTLIIKANIPPAHASYTAPNGYAVVVSGPASVTGTASTGSVTVTASGTVGTNKKINGLSCGGTSLISGTPSSGSSPANIDKVVGNTGSGLEDMGTNGYTIDCPNASGSPSKSICTITGPIGGPSCTLSATLDSSPGYTVSGNMAAGTATAGVIITSPSNPVMAGGVDPVGAGRAGVGNFQRVDILPSTGLYPKASGREDCVANMNAVTDAGKAAYKAKIDGGFGEAAAETAKTAAIAAATITYPPNACTYAEELQNFANWFSYYRTRLSLMKTTSTLAFNKLDSKYRVGFDLLSHYSQPKKIDVEVAQFVDSGGEVANQRTTWWSNLTGATTSGSTPLRSSLMKMGKYYAGKLTNGITIPAFGGTKAVGTVQVNSTTKNTAQITSLAIGSTVILDPLVDAPFIVSSCTGSGNPKSCSTANLTSVATALVNAIKSASGYAASNYIATSSGSKVIFTAKTVGDGPNGEDIQVSTAVSNINLALIDVGGGKNATPLIPPAVIEPLQYSCQQNFTLLVTDGYWNSDQYDDLTQLDGTTLIGDQDNVNSDLTARPAYDGAVDATAPCSDSSFSTCGTLADIAMYYYKTDLRDSSQGNTVSGATGLDVSTNNVFKSSTDSNQKQHMVLFTMGLGAPGTLRYTGDYATATSGDFRNIVNGPANWPAVKANDPTTIDDLWHAAVNGRGKYFSARDPDSVVKGLGDALASIDVREGAAAAAATSNLQPVAGDNFAYVASYTTNEWSGDLQARIINTTSGKVSDPANIAPNDCVSDSGCPWSAKKKLDALDWNTRKIYLASSNGAPLRAFTYSNLTATEQTYFNPGAGIGAYGTGPLSQYGSVSATHPSEITASKMVDFLRGDRCLEEGNTCTSPAIEIWRGRAHVMGDVVNTQPTFVKAPSATYQDTGYGAFLTANTSREGVVYVSGNDGMLHAIAAGDFADGTVTGGTELWSFIPTATLPYLRYLADTDYVHRYFVDGQITVADVNFGGGVGDWHTILVGGLGGGGKSYYALDVTDPLNPKYLWEFTHSNLGYTYGNITINKLPNGEWAVLFSSGYNNADGKGYLYAVNPQTGALRSGYPISNGSGTASSPSNLGKVAAWVDNLEANNTATQVYAGDMDGDLWRFDLAGQTAFKLAHLADGSNNPQPITTRPEMTLNNGLRIIYIGTGRYLGDSDPPDTSVQSFYAFADTLGVANLGGSTQVTWNPRTDNNSGTPVFLLRKLIALKDDGSQITRVNSFGNTVEARQICTGAGSVVSSSTGKCINETGGLMDWANSGGWYFDFPDTGERVNVDMNLTLGTLTIPSNIPASSACTSGGSAWVNYIDFKTGLEIDSALIVSEKIANALIVGLNVIKVGDKLVAIVTTSDFKHDATEPPGAPGKFKGKRDLWRELDLY